MAGGAAGAPTSGATGQATAQGMPSQASQYSNYGAQQSYQPQYQQPQYQQSYQPQYQQSYQQPQFGGGYGQGYGSPFGGMGGNYGYQQAPQYGYGGMGNQFMGGGMYGPRGGFGRGGFDPRMVMQQMYGQQDVAQQPQTATAAPGRTEEDWNKFAAQARFAPGADMEQVKKNWMAETGPAFGGFRGPRRGFGGYGGGFDPRMMRGGFGGYEF